MTTRIRHASATTLCIYCEAPVRRAGQFIAEACEHCEREVLTDNPYLLGSET